MNSISNQQMIVREIRSTEYRDFHYRRRDRQWLFTRFALHVPQSRDRRSVEITERSNGDHARMALDENG